MQPLAPELLCISKYERSIVRKIKRLVRRAGGMCLMVAAIGLVLLPAAYGREIGSVRTHFKLLGANDRIVIEAFDDPDISGATCYLSRARTGASPAPSDLPRIPPTPRSPVGRPARSCCRKGCDQGRPTAKGYSDGRPPFFSRPCRSCGFTTRNATVLSISPIPTKLSKVRRRTAFPQFPSCRGTSRVARPVHDACRATAISYHFLRSISSPRTDRVTCSTGTFTPDFSIARRIMTFIAEQQGTSIMRTVILLRLQFFSTSAKRSI